MDVQVASGAEQRSDTRGVQALARREVRAVNSPLRQVQPSMGQGEPVPAPFDADPELVLSVLAADGDIVIRRRSSSTGDGGVAERPGSREMAFVRQLARDIRRENRAGVNKAGRELSKLGCDRQLIDELIARHHHYHRILRALAGGNARASDTQLAQAFALCVFDVNRQQFMREVLEAAGTDEPSSTGQACPDPMLFRRMVQGAKRLTQFDDLRPMVALWGHIRLDVRGPEREVMRLSLVNTIGLFHTNAQRFLGACDDAAPAGRNADLLQRLPSCLARQWMTGCSDQEREALRGASGEQCAEFHRKLNQQYALLCRSFGLPLPALAELILIDTDDQASGKGIEQAD